MATRRRLILINLNCIYVLVSWLSSVKWQIFTFLILDNQLTLHSYRDVSETDCRWFIGMSNIIFSCLSESVHNWSYSLGLGRFYVSVGTRSKSKPTRILFRLSWSYITVRVVLWVSKACLLFNEKTRVECDLLLLFAPNPFKFFIALLALIWAVAKRL